MRTVVTAGHVDHGKSTLVRALTGMEPDRLEEERRRGLSIELGYAWCLLPEAGDDMTVAFVDVPGHERFLAKMLAGAGTAPAALLVVAADAGWQAQSQEHLDVLDLLDVPVVAAVVSRASLASEDRSAAVRDDVIERLGASRTDVPVVVADAVEGTGIEDLRRVLADRLAALPEPADTGLVRLWLDRVFTIRGAGTVATGTLQGGALRRGDELAVSPSGRRVRVRGLQSLGRTVEEARPGDRVAVNLAGVETDEIARGDVLVPLPPPETTSEFEAVVRVLPGQELGATGAWRVHVGTASATARVRPVRGRPIPGGDRSGVRLVIERVLPLLVGDRFVLREEGRGTTVAGGRVADVAPAAPARGRGAREARDRALAEVVDAEGEARLMAMLALGGGVVALDRLRGLDTGDALSRPGGPRRIGSVVVDAPTRRAWAEAVRDLLAREGQVDQTRLAGALTERGCPPESVGAVVQTLERAGVVARRGPRFIDPSAQDTFDAAVRERRESLLAALDANPFQPPDLEDAVRAAGATVQDVEALRADRRIVVYQGIAFTSKAVHIAIERLSQLERRQGPFTASSARQELGTTRKFAIPLLEVLDGMGATVFDGALRTFRRN